MIVTSASLVLAFVAGLGIGLWYFGGLWFTVQRVPTARHPALLLLGSFLVRTLTSVGGFFIIMQESGMLLVVSLGGFFVLRTIMVSRSAYSLTGLQYRS